MRICLAFVDFVSYGICNALLLYPFDKIVYVMNSIESPDMPGAFYSVHHKEHTKSMHICLSHRPLCNIVNWYRLIRVFLNNKPKQFVLMTNNYKFEKLLILPVVCRHVIPRRWLQALNRFCQHLCSSAVFVKYCQDFLYRKK